MASEMKFELDLIKWLDTQKKKVVIKSTEETIEMYVENKKWKSLVGLFLL